MEPWREPRRDRRRATGVTAPIGVEEVVPIGHGPRAPKHTGPGPAAYFLINVPPPPPTRIL